MAIYICKDCESYVDNDYHVGEQVGCFLICPSCMEGRERRKRLKTVKELEAKLNLFRDTDEVCCGLCNSDDERRNRYWVGESIEHMKGLYMLAQEMLAEMKATDTKGEQPANN